MTADYWMGLAVGIVSVIIAFLVILFVVILSVGKSNSSVKLASERGAELLAERNKIGRLQVSALMEIVHRLEGIYDRMPEPSTGKEKSQ